jgi:hypothetical protein
MSDNRATQAKTKTATLYTVGAVAFIGFFSVISMLGWLVTHMKVSP